VLRRELDWIVMMCLRKDRNQRYETANGLAMDVARYLEGEAIVAVPPTWRYQLSKLARKHKKTFAMAAVIAVILAGATAFSTWQAIRATRAEEAQRQDSQFAKTLNDFLLEDFLSISDAWADDTRSAPRKVDLTLFEAIVAAEKLVGQRFAQHTNTEARVRFIIGRALAQFTNSPVAFDNLKRSYELFREVHGEIHTNTLEVKLAYGSLLYSANREFFRGMAEEDKARRESNHREGYRLILEAKDDCEAALPAGHPLTSRALFRAAEVTQARDFTYPDRPRLNQHQEEARRLFERAIKNTEVAIAAGDENLTPLLLLAKRHQLGPNPTEAQRRQLNREILQLEEGWHRKINPSGPYPLRYAQNLMGVIRDLQHWDRDFEQADRLIARGLGIATNQVGRADPTGGFYSDLIRIPAIDRGDFAAAFAASREALACFEATGKNPEWIKVYAGYVLADAAAWGDWQQTLDELASMRERGLGRDPEGRGYALNLARELLVRKLLGATNPVPELRRQFWEAAAGQKLFHETEMLLALPFTPEERDQLIALTDRAIERESDPALGHVWESFATPDSLRGLKAFRLTDDLATARTELEKNPESPLACFHLATIHWRQGDPETARRHLQRGERLFENLLARGNLRRFWFNDETWTTAARTWLAREEAEGLILGGPVARASLKEHLAGRRPGWNEVRKLMYEAEWQARQRQFTKARDLHRQMTNHPAFNFQSAREGHEIGPRMFVIDWALGDTNAHLGILRQMHENMAETETEYLFQLAEVPWPLPDDLRRRREQSRARAWLERKATTPEVSLAGWEPFLLGMLRYREDRFEEALQLFSQGIEIEGRAFSAMAHWKLENQEEARALLKQADEMYYRGHILPGGGMYQPWFPESIMMEMVIKEADQLIDPGVDNAPHVAALPPEGWSR